LNSRLQESLSQSENLKTSSNTLPHRANTEWRRVDIVKRSIRSRWPTFGHLSFKLEPLDDMRRLLEDTGPDARFDKNVVDRLRLWFLFSLSLYYNRTLYPCTYANTLSFIYRPFMEAWYFSPSLMVYQSINDDIGTLYKQGIMS